MANTLKGKTKIEKPKVHNPQKEEEIPKKRKHQPDQTPLSNKAQSEAERIARKRALAAEHLSKADHTKGGRPQGSKDKSVRNTQSSTTTPKKVGRPKGSKDTAQRKKHIPSVGEKALQTIIDILQDGLQQSSFNEAYSQLVLTTINERISEIGREKLGAIISDNYGRAEEDANVVAYDSDQENVRSSAVSLISLLYDRSLSFDEQVNVRKYEEEYLSSDTPVSEFDQSEKMI